MQSDLWQRWHECAVGDNRTLAYAEFGQDSGHPVFYFHGFPGSRLEAALVTSHALRLGLRVIAVDRPGFGRSNYKPGRRIGDWPRDVERLADHLGLRDFSVLGVSGGGPYAMACAHGLRERVRRITLVGALGPIHNHGLTLGMRRFDRTMLAVFRRSHRPAFPLVAMVGWVIRHHTDRVFDHLARSGPEKDRLALRAPEFRAPLAASFREAVRAGYHGCALDLHLLAQPWDFLKLTLNIPAHIFHGEEDTIVPVQHGRRLAREFTRCVARFLPSEGHYSVVYNHLENILASALPA